MHMVTNKQVIFSKRPTDYPVANEHLTIRETTIDLDAPLSEGQFILKQLAISMDPYMRNRMREKFVIPPFVLGKPITGYAISVVIKSNNPNFVQGDVVHTTSGVHEEYTLVPSPVGGDNSKYELRNEIKMSGLPVTYYLGALGMPGATAYFSLLDVAKPKAGESILISSAAGTVGSLVGQMAKARGLHVVGSAGSDDKCAMLKEELGFDDAFNYKTSNIDQKLAELFPGGIDIYLDNVGGKMLEAAIDHSKKGGRIVVCGMVSQYNREKPEGVHNLERIIGKALTIYGFMQLNYQHLQEKARKDMTKWLLEGKIQNRETVLHGIDQVPQAMENLMRGTSVGKQVVKVAEL